MGTGTARIGVKRGGCGRNGDGPVRWRTNGKDGTTFPRTNQTSGLGEDRSYGPIGGRELRKANERGMDVRATRLSRRHSSLPSRHKSGNSFPRNLAKQARDRDTQPVEEEVRLPAWKEGTEGEEAGWLAHMLQMHLDEEWTPLDVHRDVGKVAASIYVQERKRGVDDLGSIVLAVGTQMTAFDFHETFVDSFQVANKTSELLMWKMGREVCCTSQQDLDDFQRYEELLRSEDPRGEEGPNTG